MVQGEDDLAMAARHVREGEARVARQARLVAQLPDGHPQRETDQARRLLTNLETTLYLARDHLRIERASRRAGGLTNRRPRNGLTPKPLTAM